MKSKLKQIFFSFRIVFLLISVVLLVLVGFTDQNKTAYILSKLGLLGFIRRINVLKPTVPGYFTVIIGLLQLQMELSIHLEIVELMLIGIEIMIQIKSILLKEAEMIGSRYITITTE